MRNMQCAKFKVQSKDMDILQYTFFQNALIGALLASILCGFVGTYIVTRRLVFISGGITHASFGGIGIGVFAGYNYWKEDTEHKDGTKDTFSYKRIPVSLKYGINSNFKVWTEAEFDAGSDVKKSKLKSGTQFSAGARYTF